MTLSRPTTHNKTLKPPKQPETHTFYSCVGNRRRASRSTLLQRTNNLKYFAAEDLQLDLLCYWMLATWITFCQKMYNLNHFILEVLLVGNCLNYFVTANWLLELLWKSTYDIKIYATIFWRIRPVGGVFVDTRDFAYTGVGAKDKHCNDCQWYRYIDTRN